MWVPVPLFGDAGVAFAVATRKVFAMPWGPGDG